MSEHLNSKPELPAQAETSPRNIFTLTDKLRVASVVGTPLGMLATVYGILNNESSVVVAGLTTAGVLSIGRLTAIDRARSREKKIEAEIAAQVEVLEQPIEVAALPVESAPVVVITPEIVNGKGGQRVNHAFGNATLSRLAAFGILGATFISGMVFQPQAKAVEAPRAASILSEFGNFTVGDPNSFNRSIPEDGLIDSKTGQIIPKEDLISIFDLSERLWAEHIARINPDDVKALEQIKKQFTPAQAAIYQYQIDKMIALIHNKTVLKAKEQGHESPFLADDPSVCIWYREDPANPEDRVWIVWPKNVATTFREVEADFLSRARR